MIVRTSAFPISSTHLLISDTGVGHSRIGCSVHKRIAGGFEAIDKRHAHAKPEAVART